ncbi:MAG: ribonuclease [Deltaproteobacteria bacterium RIFOXYA12_FULL_58_15]|nr:MAG: ribonuclease [Deltaproteobacteria bacterium RIFOXYA12_FULL_58_15]OGR10951.1 MAG: ribonuclease [Deltaproteobacteria bacterium RIFOXYB12_FULL_58_9]
MVIDTSAIVALLNNEADAELFEIAVADAPQACMSTATVLECSLVLESRYGDLGGQKLDLLISEQEIEIVPFNANQLRIARAAFHRFGKGRHPAQLNFGDCFSYALAKERGLPLLYKGRDFSQTDVESMF